MKNYKINISSEKLRNLKEEIGKALELTGEYIHTDLVQSQTMPFVSGNLQNESTFVDGSEKNDGLVRLVHSTPYARRLYYHPEYKFTKLENIDAGAYWYKPYIKGEKENLALETFKKIYKRNTGV